jgi:pimeloyl-ACP methyl ester carboxylesterase
MALYWIWIALGVGASLIAVFVLYTAVVCFIFLATMMRVFEEMPIFVPPNEPPDPTAEDIRFPARAGIWLQGSWLPKRSAESCGTIVFCHEYRSNRWSCRPYCEPLRESGFDIFAFDFRNHGDSDSSPGYAPMQWVSNFEVVDVLAALSYVRTRVGGSRPWIGLLGVSRGGGAAILGASRDPGVSAVCTDGAFPTNLTQLAYMLRWAKIYIGEGLLYRVTPDWYYSLLCGIARTLAARRHGCRFLRVARAIRRIAPRPLLMIHGAKDNYVAPEVAQQLFERARQPKQFWLVPGARHNGSVTTAGSQYASRLVKFFQTAR